MGQAGILLSPLLSQDGAMTQRGKGVGGNMLPSPVLPVQGPGRLAASLTELAHRPASPLGASQHLLQRGNGDSDTVSLPQPLLRPEHSLCAQHSKSGEFRPCWKERWIATTDGQRQKGKRAAIHRASLQPLEPLSGGYIGRPHCGTFPPGNSHGRGPRERGGVPLPSGASGR